jgi:Mce-associated membrane protein
VTTDKTSVCESPTADVERPADVDSVGDTDVHGKVPGRLKRLASRAKQRLPRKILPALLALSVAASLGLLGGLLHFTYRPDRETDADAAKAAISAASEGTVAVLSYSPDTLDRDFSSAKSRLTGDFLKYYDQFTQRIVAPATKEKSVKTTAVVLRAALTDLHPDSAVVLLFVNQSTQTKDRPEPTFSSSAVMVTLAKADGKWLISAFNPL